MSEYGKALRIVEENDDWDAISEACDEENKMTYEEMWDLVKASLYKFDGEVATPNYKYCRPDAPVYVLVADKFVLIAGVVTKR